MRAEASRECSAPHPYSSSFPSYGGVGGEGRAQDLRGWYSKFQVVQKKFDSSGSRNTYRTEKRKFICFGGWGVGSNLLGHLED